MDMADMREDYPGRMSAVDTIARIIFGLSGGVLLLIPLIVLTFIKSTNYRLLAVSLFVLMFVALISVFSRASNQELAGATAAYAAVLVVFVGAALSSS
jgi:hypothetical protein